ncbi:type VI secretion system Vgr family protein [Roseomonas sp. WA12]
MLRPHRLTGTEGISEPFRFDVVAEAEEAISPADMLDKPACVALRLNEDDTRHFHGIVAECTAFGPEIALGYRYRLVLQPRLVSAGLSEDCRMFFDQGADDIIRTVLADCGIDTVTFKLFGAVARREATAQFNETALHFVTRLMEEEGWFYFFDHSADDHTMIITNGNAGFLTRPNVALRTDRALGAGETGDAITGWELPVSVTHGAITLSDYDPDAPEKRLQTKQASLLGHPRESKRPVFHWPALTGSTTEVAARAKLRMQAAEAEVSVVQGGTRFGGLFPGGRFTVEHASGGADPYVVKQVQHDASQPFGRTESAAGERYDNRFTAFPYHVPWRQPVTTARPRMEGLHTAIVLAPAGEEIHTDAQGRIKIRFFWDWRKTATADNSPFVRVVQPWAGNGWGGQFIPRAGTEVAIAFMDADPDRPVVVGGFYNGKDSPIFPEAEKTKTGFRSRSSLKGGTDDFNEFSFDDSKGKEVVFLHAQKDLKTEVENDETHTVDHDRTAKVLGKETVTVKGDRTHEVTEGHEALTVKQGNRTVVVETGNQATNITKGNHALEIETGNQSVLLKTGNQTTKLSTGNLSVVLDMGDHSTRTKIGDISLKADLGTISLEALKSITLKVGQSTLTLGPEGLELKGMTVKLDGTLSTEVKGLMLKADGTAMLTLKGGITMIN